jgi:hypothetical protein
MIQLRRAIVLILRAPERYHTHAYTPRFLEKVISQSPSADYRQRRAMAVAAPSPSALGAVLVWEDQGGRKCGLYRLKDSWWSTDYAESNHPANVRRSVMAESDLPGISASSWGKMERTPCVHVAEAQGSSPRTSTHWYWAPRAVRYTHATRGETSDDEGPTRQRHHDYMLNLLGGSDRQVGSHTSVTRSCERETDSLGPHVGPAPKEMGPARARGVRDSGPDPSLAAQHR